MFTPPPSPIPFPKFDEDPSSSEVSPSSLTKDSLEPFHDSPKSPTVAEAGPSRLTMLSEDARKKRMGRRTLLLVAIFPATLVITASIRHFLPFAPIPTPLLTSPERLSVPVAAIAKRDPQSGTPTSSSAPAQSNPTGPTTTSAALPTIPTDPVLPTPFPQPFDQSLSYNFSTQGCQAFFLNFTQTEEFRQCRAMSFLLNSSAAFIQAQQNVTLFNSILFGTCNTPRSADDCRATMDSLLSQLNDQCKVDLSDQNQSVLEAQIGFQSYTAMRTVGCLQNPSDNTYCYMDAVAASVPSDIYFYSLPLGTPVPPNVTPTCGACVKSVMSVFAQYVDAKGSSSPVSITGTSTGNSSASNADVTPLPVLTKVYPAAAQLAVDTCGGTYASVGATTSVALHHGVSWGVLLLSLLFGCLWMP